MDDASITGESTMTQQMERRNGVAHGRRLSTEVAATLEKEIRAGIYPPNSRMPTEALLMERFAMSRAVIREAISER